MMLCRPTLIAAVVAIMGCRTQTLPAHLVDPGMSPHPDYPKADFICGLGIHSGTADAISIAGDKAKAAVASQVQSSIVAEFERVDSVSITNDPSATTSASRSEATIAIESRFAHGELIRVVDSSTGSDAARALACLDRGEAAAKLAEAIDPQRRRHHTAVSRARAARDANDLQGFSSAYLEAIDAHNQAAPGMVQARTILGRMPAEHTAMYRDHETLQQWGASVRSDAKLCVSGLRASDAVAVEAALPSLARMGLSATAANRCDMDCTVGMSISLNDGCPERRSSIGIWVCQPQLTIELRSCASGKTLASGTVKDKSLNGSGNRKDLAKRQVLERLNSTRFDAPLGRSVASVLPIP